MTRARAGAIGLGVVALLALLFFGLFERVEEEVDRPFGSEARRNPLLAAERLMARLGVPARSVVRLESVPPPAEVVVFADSSRMRTQAEATRVLEWVARGGRAIVAVPNGMDDETVDPLLDGLGVVVHEPERLWAGYLRLTLPDLPEPLFLRWYGGQRVEALEEGEPLGSDLLQPRFAPEADEAERRKVDELLARLRRDREGGDDERRTRPLSSFPTPEETDDDLAPILRVPFEAGEVIVLTDATFLGNRQIGDLDHARAAWALISRGGAPAGVVFVHGSSEPALFSTIVAAVWPGLVALALLLGAVAWRTGRRFGPAERDAGFEHRSLMEHVEATGRFHWRRGGVEVLLGGVRRAIAIRLQRRRPHLADQPLDRRVAALAELASLSPAEVEHALTPGAPGGADDFTRSVRTLEAIRRHL